MNKNHRQSILLVGILLLGAFVTTYRAHGFIPYYPMDFVSYLGGYYAARDGVNPYDMQQAGQSLEQRGVFVTPYRFVYPPPFLLTMIPLEIIPYRLYRLGWIAASVLAAWLSVLLLSKGTGRLKTLFVAGSFVFLTVSEPLHDNLVCGQITSFMLLALSLMVLRGFKGALAVVAATFLLLTKVAFMPLVLFLKGRRALLVVTVLLLCLSFSSVFLAGFHAFHDWISCLRLINESWGFGCSNNLSVTHAVCLFTETVLVQGDMERAGRDDEYRFDLAGRQRFVSSSLFLIFVVIVFVYLFYRLYKKRKNSIRCSRENILAQGILFLLVFIPTVWIHYGMFFLIPFRQLAVKGRSVPAILFILSAMVWGTSLTLVPVWTRFLIPLVWLFSSAFLNDTFESDGMQPQHREAESR